MRSSNYKKKRGFTLIELLVVISIIALLIAILLPSLGRARELANEAVCSANVRGIIQSMFIYAQTNQNQFPASQNANTTGTISAGGIPGTPTATPAAYDPIAIMQAWESTSQVTGDPLSCLWFLVLSGQDTPKSFICPSDPVATTPSMEYQTATSGLFNTNFNQDGGVTPAEVASNATIGAGESYSIADPWPLAGSSTGYWWTSNAGADLPLVSDMAPASPGAGAGTTARATTTAVAGNTSGNYIYNSGNHLGNGENVGFGDDHVTFATNPYVGQSGDNIFTFQPSATAAPGSTTYAAKQTPVTTSTAAVTIYTASAPYDICMIPVRDVSSGAW